MGAILAEGREKEGASEQGERGALGEGSQRRVVLVFAGQGSERAGMGCALARRDQRMRERFELASAILGVDTLRLLERGGSLLRKTQIVQPVMTAFASGIVSILRAEGVSYGWVLGHSLGEVAALSAAGYCDAEAAIRLAATRGALMGALAETQEGAMAALQGIEEAHCAEALSVARQHGILEIAARHDTALWTLTGERKALDILAKDYPLSFLSTSGAWHSPLMEAARLPFFDAARSALLGTPHAAWITNHTGDVIEITADAPRLLAEQMTHPILWLPSMQTLARLGVTDAILCGPHHALTSLLRRSLPQLALHPTEAPRLLDATLSFFL